MCEWSEHTSCIKICTAVQGTFMLAPIIFFKREHQLSRKQYTHGAIRELHTPYDHKHALGYTKLITRPLILRRHAGCEFFCFYFLPLPNKESASTVTDQGMPWKSEPLCELPISALMGASRLLSSGTKGSNGSIVHLFWWKDRSALWIGHPLL